MWLPLIDDLPDSVCNCYVAYQKSGWFPLLRGYLCRVRTSLDRCGISSLMSGPPLVLSFYSPLSFLLPFLEGTAHSSLFFTFISTALASSLEGKELNVFIFRVSNRWVCIGCYKNHWRPGILETIEIFGIWNFWKLKSLGSKHWQILCLVRAHFLVTGRAFSCPHVIDGMRGLYLYIIFVHILCNRSICTYYLYTYYLIRLH